MLKLVYREWRQRSAAERTGGRAEAWCLLIHADASLFLSPAAEREEPRTRTKRDGRTKRVEDVQLKWKRCQSLPGRWLRRPPGSGARAPSRVTIYGGSISRMTMNPVILSV